MHKGERVAAGGANRRGAAAAAGAGVGLDAALAGILGIVSPGRHRSILVISPYAFIDWQQFRQQVTEQTMLSQGQLDYPYVRQFADATPYIYPLRQLAAL